MMECGFPINPKRKAARTTTTTTTTRTNDEAAAALGGRRRRLPHPPPHTSTVMVGSGFFPLTETVAANNDDVDDDDDFLPSPVRPVSAAKSRAVAQDDLEHEHLTPLPLPGRKKKKQRVQHPRPCSPVTAAVTTAATANSPDVSSCRVQPTAGAELPGHFKRLLRTFRAINTVYSFVALQRQITCTYEMLKPSVDAMLHQSEEISPEGGAGGLEDDNDFEKENHHSLRLEDLASVRVLLPDVVDLYWAERSSLVEASVFDLATNTGGAGVGRWKQNASVGEDDFALVIEFKDVGRAKAAKGKRVLDAKGFRINSDKLSLVKEAAQPSSGISVLSKLVDRRNRNFEAALMLFHQTAVDQAANPTQKLRRLALSAIPLSPDDTTSKNEDCAPVLKSWMLTSGEDTLKDLLDQLRNAPIYVDQIVENGWIINEARAPVFAQPAKRLSDSIKTALLSCRGINDLYIHQARAIDHIDEGSSVVVATSTSSGKSLVYQIPVLKELESNPDARAFFIFPTKALAQDQKRSLKEILSFCPRLSDVEIETYDGDTSLCGYERSRIREQASVIFTNPDMLHVSILPNHARWKPFLENLRFVIIDELHYYSGRFGANCAMVMRRLRRICALYHNYNIQFISCSATISNPTRHMKAFVGIETVAAVELDGSPCGRKHQIIWNPPLRNPSESRQGRHSFLEEGVKVCALLACRRVRFICFARVRSMCELLLRELRDFLLAGEVPELADSIMSYRGGYTPEERRDIERRMFKGELLGIVATNALELGVDIGSLDAVVHLGFPFNQASYRQQLGRAGRREKESVSIMIANGENRMDQYFVEHPERLFKGSLDAVVIDIENELIVEGHLQCTAAEHGILPEDIEIWFGRGNEEGAGKAPDDAVPKKSDTAPPSPTAPQDINFYDRGRLIAAVEDLRKNCVSPGDIEDRHFSALAIGQRSLVWDSVHGVFVASPKFDGVPARFFQIRGSDDDDPFRIIDITTNKDIEDIEARRAPFTVYEGAILIHQGKSFQVIEINYDRRYAKARPTRVDYITAVRDFTNIDPIETKDVIKVRDKTQAAPDSLNAYLGVLKVSTVCFGFFKINPSNRQILEACTGMESPPIINEVNGFWIDVPPAAVAHIEQNSLRRDRRAEFGIHAANHAVLSLLPKVVMVPTTGQTDIRADCKSPLAKRFRPPRIVVFESLKTGVLDRAFRCVGELLQKALDRVESCPCENGCPQCVCVSSCKEINTALDKWGCVQVLRGVLGLEFSVP